MFKRMMALGACFILLSALTACSKKCDHEYTSETIAEATCASQGVIRSTCTKCGDIVEEKTVKSDKHTYTEKITKDATCTEAGEKTNICSLCAHIEEGTVAAKGHDFKILKTSATCTQGGTEEKLCNRCGYKTVKKVGAYGHQWEGYSCLKPMTCKVCNSTEGTKGPHTTIQGTCKTCGKMITDYVTMVRPTADALTIHRNAAAEASTHYSEKIPDEANAYHITKAYELGYQAISDASHICDQLADVPTFKKSHEAFMKIYALKDRFEKANVTADNVKDMALAFDKDFKDLADAISKAYAALKEELEATGFQHIEAPEEVLD